MAADGGADIGFRVGGIKDDLPVFDKIELSVAGSPFSSGIRL